MKERVAMADRKPRALIAVGSGFALVGLALVGTGTASRGDVVTLAGLVAMIAGIHAFGRLGAES